MPTDFYNHASTDIDDIIAEIGQEFAWNGVTYKGYYNRVSRGDSPTEGGAWEEYDSTMVVNRDSLPSIPVQGDKVTVDGSVLYVQQVKHDPALPPVTIFLRNNPIPQT